MDKNQIINKLIRQIETVFETASSMEYNAVCNDMFFEEFQKAYEAHIIISGDDILDCFLYNEKYVDFLGTNRYLAMMDFVEQLCLRWDEWLYALDKYMLQTQKKSG